MRSLAILVLCGGAARADRPRALDELPLEGTGSVQLDAEHADGSDALAVVPGVRLGFGERGFLSLALPAGWQHQIGDTVLGNATATVGVVAKDAALALRFGAPTGPTLGDGRRTATALATPRVADSELFMPATTALELVADKRWDRAATWLQLEGGLMARTISDRPLEAVARISVAGGVRVESWLDLTASFVTRVTFHPDSEHFVHALVLGAIVHASLGQIAVRIEVPVDDSARTYNRFVAGVAVTY